MDLIEGTSAAWMEALTHNRVWDESQDLPRIRSAFSTLLATSAHWPSPSKLIEAMPAVVNHIALPKTTLTNEQQMENLKEVQELLKQALP